VYLPGFPIKNFQLSRYGKISFINVMIRVLSYKSATQRMLNA
jgi:hypothetical protein